MDPIILENFFDKNLSKIHVNNLVYLLDYLYLIG